MGWVGWAGSTLALAMGKRSQLSDTVCGEARAPGTHVTMWTAEAIGAGGLSPWAVASCCAIWSCASRLSSSWCGRRPG
jgi:hypothetical protein